MMQFKPIISNLDSRRMRIKREDCIEQERTRQNRIMTDGNIEKNKGKV
jgi:hypothetical protein